MKKSVLVIGIAGSGKSAVSRELNNSGYKAYDIEEIEGLFQMVNKRTREVYTDPKNNSLERVKNMDWICDVKKLKEIIKNERNEVAFYCGTASNLDDLIPLFDKIILLKPSPDVLRQRLSTRTPEYFGGIKEVQDWILSWKDWWEDSIQKKGAIVINANGDLKDIVKEIIKN